MSKLTIIGIGPGSEGYVMPAAVECMKLSHTVIAARRILPVLISVCGETGAAFEPMGKIKDTLLRIDGLLKQGKDVGLVVSGDPLMYSLYNTIRNDPVSSGWEIVVLPGIGSLQMLGAAFGETMEDARIISVHGRSRTRGSIALAVTESPKVFFLCSKEQGPAWLSDIMLDYGLSDVTVYAGANLSYEDEMLLCGSPAEMVQNEYPSLCVAMIKNPAPREVVRPRFLTDADFERDKTPMTKEEIRVLILHQMRIEADDIIWDVGAGTGSVSIECARQAPFGQVYAVERGEAAVSLIKKNKEKFGTDNLHVYHGDAVEVVRTLPLPRKVFIGGSGGKLAEIMEVIASFDSKVQVTIAAVTIETIAEAEHILSRYDPDYKLVQATIGRGRRIGQYHIVDTNNPVLLFTGSIREPSPD